MDKQKLTEALLKADGIDPAAPTDSEWASFETILDEQSNTKRSRSSRPRSLKRSRFMNQSLFKYAASIIIVTSVLTAIYQITGSIDGASVAWGSVVEKVTEARSFIFKHRIFVSDSESDTESSPVMDMTLYISEENGFRMDMLADNHLISWYVPKEADTITMVIPQEKKCLKMPYSEETSKQLPEKDPIDYLRRFMECDYIECGSQLIDNTETQYIEVQNPPTDGEKLENAVGRLWVNVETNLPVRLEIEGTADSKNVRWIMDFRWEENMKASLFEPDISDDYSFVEFP